MRDAVAQFVRDEEAATSIEYAVMLALIAGVCIASVGSMSNATADSFDTSATELASALGGS
ncbi:Flp/Fap pilin component [Pseudobythopirellula maris]|uniref:Flp/Fap pilin component n=1 Tax=Pseudobythopirellula maris TaxID=2527991 RepID=A0A5C5ZLP6_9BACT|nr:Flp family type IVb pilin [Pseudobythopirellula maris]TWT88374.1 Flp/Fap pilin component [Pseudobythopirellula maris]